MPSRPIDRRDFIKSSALAGGALLGGLPAVGASVLPRARERKTRHVVLIAFAGGVRTRETFGTPANVPNLRAMADEGVLYTRVRSPDLGHAGAALSMFTGISEARGLREGSRGPDPTLFEYLRKDLGLPAGDVWIATSSAAPRTNCAFGLHADFGPRFGANTIDGDGRLNEELENVLDSFGRPLHKSERNRELLTRMSWAGGIRGPGAGNRMLAELTRGTAEIRGVNAADARTLRVARNLLTIFRPRLVCCVLQQADVAHGSFDAYVEVIRRNDAVIGELWSAVKGAEELRDSTALLVVPEFGRDRELNPRRGLDHGDGSDDLRYVSAVAWGPDFGKGRVVEQDVRAIDVCPTVCELMGASAAHSRGERLPRLFA